MIRTIVRLAATLALIGAAGAAQAAIDRPVRIQGGLLQGVPGRTPGVRVFKGVPFAAPPVGALRWKPPAPPASWPGVRPAGQFGPDCIPLRPAAQSAAPSAGEDCLYLNVWTPAKTPADKLPVMVWIYGGAFTGGSAAVPQFDGEGLSRKGVILVSLNYRTGVLGFLSHPLLTAESPHHASGNYGLLDMMAALKWVRENIARFGGDPGRVTIFGQSSGSESVAALTVSPLAKGLFQRAIGESGSGFGERQPRSLAKAEALGVAYATPLGANLAALRSASPQTLIAAAKLGDFEPVVDGWVLPADMHDRLAKGRQNDVPLLVGSNADESQLSDRTTRESYEERVRGRFAGRSDQVLQRFPAPTDQAARLSMKTVWTMLLGDFNAYSWVGGQVRTGRSAAYQYRFTHAPPPFSPPGSPPGPPAVGAPHGGEIVYAFNNLDAQDRTWTAEDRRLAEVISSYWTNFAKAGDPNGPGLPWWPRLSPRSSQVLELGDTVRPIPRPNADMLGFFEDAFYGPGGIYR